ncbi:MAG: DoxX family protein [Gemmatimonadaceae bacterium]|nr:DoxX family protein [Gemmatimonadaceae bacterium]
MPMSLLVTGLVFILAGALHFVMPRFYLAMMPAYLPSPLALVYVSGVFEMLGGAGLLVPAARTAAAIGLIALLVAVLPANIEMLRAAHERGAGTPFLAVLWLRLPMQPLLMWWVWRVSRSGRDLVA